MKLLASMVAKISRGPKFFGSSLAQTPPVLKVVLQAITLTQVVYTKVKVVSFNGCKISRGSQNVWQSPLAQPHANFVPKSCFSGESQFCYLLF